MKLIKISDHHYIITDDTPIQLGDWVYDTNEDWQEGSRIIEKANHTLYLDPRCGYEKITYSTKPLESDVHLSHYYFGDIKPLSISAVKELIGVNGIKSKWEKIKEDLLYFGFSVYKEKEYTEEDLREAWDLCTSNKGVGYVISFSDLMHSLQSLHSKKEWEVEFVDGKLKLV